MPIRWEEAFTQVEHLPSWSADGGISGILHVGSLQELKAFLDVAHIKHCLLKPYAEVRNYPLVEARELLPSFEVDLFEYKELPGFSLVAFERPINSFSEIFQFDRLYNVMDLPELDSDKACPLVNTVISQNIQTFRSRLPRRHHDGFLARFGGKDISYLENYPALIPFLLELERAHVLSMDAHGEFYLSGMYGSLPSDLDAEIKRFGLKARKFRPGDSTLYERNRLFVYQFLMELYGFPIVSERRTSAALFARRLQRQGEKFLVRVLGQSDRTITTMWSHPTRARHYPRVEKTALVAVHPEQKEAIKALKDGGWFADPRKKVVILRVIYRQHRFNPMNVRQDRALSVLRQEIIHPLTGQVRTDVNIIKDTSNMVLKLTDIVRGEHTGMVTYKRQELVQDTDTHEKRLKFLHVWLTKHQRRIIGYSDEFYAQVVKVLDSYLLSPDNFDAFNDLHELYQEVWANYSYIQQARKVRLLEDLLSRNYRGKQISYKEMLEVSTEVMNDLKYEIVNYFGSLVEHVLRIGEQMLADRYLVRNYADKKDDDLTPYGQSIKKLYRRLVAIMDEFRSVRRARGDDGAPERPGDAGD